MAESRQEHSDEDVGDSGAIEEGAEAAAPAAAENEADVGAEVWGGGEEWDEDWDDDEEWDEASDEDDDDDDEDWDDDDDDDEPGDPENPELVKKLEDHGVAVFRHYWEGGAGAYATYVYKLEGAYYLYDMFDGTVGDPCSTLLEALTDEALTVTGATTEIDCTELDFDTLSDLLNADDTMDEPVFVNGRDWPPAEEAGEAAE